MGKIVTPEAVHNLIFKVKSEGKKRFEMVGKIDYCGDSISEKLVVFWVDWGVVVFRAKMRNFDGFLCKTYEEEKYRNDCGNYDKIVAEIDELRREWTSGVYCGDRVVKQVF